MIMQTINFVSCWIFMGHKCKHHTLDSALVLFRPLALHQCINRFADLEPVCFDPTMSWIFSEVKKNIVVMLYRMGSKSGEFCRETCYLLLNHLKMSVVQLVTINGPHCLDQQICWDLLPIFQSLLYLIFINICFCETCLANVCDEWPLLHSSVRSMAF